MTRREQERRGKTREGFEAAAAADSCCYSSNNRLLAPQIRLLAGCAGRRRWRRRWRPLAAAQPALRHSAAWLLRGLRPLRLLRDQRPLRGHSGRCAASLVPAAAGSSGGDAAHLQQQQHLVVTLRVLDPIDWPCTELQIQIMKFWSNRLKIETRNSKLETEN